MFNTARGQLFGSSRGNRLGFRATILTATDRPWRRRLRASVSRATLLWLMVATVTLLGAFVFYHLSRPGKSQIVVSDASTANAKASPKTEADFAHESRRLRDQALLKVGPQVFVPTASRTSTSTHYPWKTNIVTIVFWIGEQSTQGSRSMSSWDQNWMQNYGGIDDPDPNARQNYIPTKFVPRQNPFYCALPYNDVTHGQFKPEVPLVIPWFRTAYTEPGRSVCKDSWLAIRKGNRVCYAQWEDTGPFRDDHFQYVFQNERPEPNAKHGAGWKCHPQSATTLGSERWT
jgi:hypothetical protein